MKNIFLKRRVKIEVSQIFVKGFVVTSKAKEGKEMLRRFRCRKVFDGTNKQCEYCLHQQDFSRTQSESAGIYNKKLDF